jgi:hypothetical protein
VLTRWIAQSFWSRIQPPSAFPLPSWCSNAERHTTMSQYAICDTFDFSENPFKPLRNVCSRVFLRYAFPSLFLSIPSFSTS